MTEKKCTCSIAHNWWHCPSLGNNWKGFLMRLVMCDMTLSDKDWVNSNDPDRGIRGLRPSRLAGLRRKIKHYKEGLELFGLFFLGLLIIVLMGFSGRYKNGKDTWIEDDDPHGKGE